jgi:hypothetical protein
MFWCSLRQIISLHMQTNRRGITMRRLKEGDWVVVMDYELLPEGIDGSTYPGMPARVLEVNKDGCKLHSPCKVNWGKMPLDFAPLPQLIKITEEEADRFLKIPKRQICNREVE